MIADPSGIRGVEQWAKLCVIGRCYSERAVDGVTSCEDRYFIGSRRAGAKEDGGWLRGHWGIENGQHCSLDVSFREDYNSIQKRKGGTNFALLRKVALSLLKRYPGKGSINRKRYAAALDVSFLEEIITSADKLGDV